MDPTGANIPLPADQPAPEVLIAQGQREQIQISQGQLTQLNTISHLLGSQAAQSSLIKFNGDPKKFQDWVRSIEKYALLVNNSTDDNLKSVALQTAEGPVSDFLVRSFKSGVRRTWDDILKELKARFGEIVDSQHGLQVLRTTRQKGVETVQIYAERLLGVAEQAWPGEPLSQPLIQQQLIDVFIDGLLDSAIARKVLREAPDTLGRAVHIAVNEQNLTKKFTLRNCAPPSSQPRVKRERPQSRDSEEPMEVDAFLGRCYKCNRVGHRASQCRTKKVHAVIIPTQGLSCYKCGQQGHGLATCRNPGRPETGRCWQCGDPGHRRFDCPNRAVKRETRVGRAIAQGNQGNYSALACPAPQARA